MDRRMNEVDSTVFLPIDFLFAKTLIPEEESDSLRLLAAYLLVATRFGHLCIGRHEGKIFPSPSSFTEQESEAIELEKTLGIAFDDIPSELPPGFVFENNTLYLQKNHSLEKRFLSSLTRLCNASLFPLPAPADPDPSCTAEQALAVQRALVSPVSIISGGPGTGKTFTALQVVECILRSFPEEERKNVTVNLAAPTGKAAALLESKVLQKTGPLSQVRSGTLHSFLKTSFSDEGFQKSIYADLMLVDEASMLDSKLFLRLVENLRSGGRLVLMGDKDQLPPVESGGFFADLIDLSESIALPVTLLRQGLRAEKKEIGDLAEAILEGDFERVRNSPCVAIFSAPNEAIGFLFEAAKTYFSWDPEEDPIDLLRKADRFRFLSSIRKGPLGVDTVNTRILSGFLGSLSAKERLVCPIIIEENHPLRGFMNGDTGILEASTESLQKGVYGVSDRAFFMNKQDPNRVKSLPVSALPRFSLAYCLSIHKSQGSEYDSVAVFLPPGSEKFGKEIIYTGVTRAKKEVRVFGSEDTLASVLRRTNRRISGIVGIRS